MGAFELSNFIPEYPDIKILGSKDDKLLIYPNPFHMGLTISFYSESTYISKIRMYNTRGQKIIELKQNIYEGQNTIETNKFNYLRQGIYYILLQKNNGSFAKAGVIKL